MVNVEAKLNEDSLLLNVSGKVDTTNADEFEKLLTEAREQNPHTNIVLDFENFEYISSAGLRVILRLRKAEPTLKIINVSSDVYEVFEMTGFSEMIPIQKAFKKLDVTGCDIIGKGAKGIIYRYDPETVVKVYINPESLPQIQNERNLARKAFVLGIPTAISYDVVKVGESYASVFELLDSYSYSELIKKEPENFDKYVKEVADLLRQIHTTKVSEDDMPDIKPLVNNWIETDKDYLKPETYEKFKKMVNEVPDKNTMLHCDFHTNNVMNQNGEAILIDMDTLSHGHPIFELANIYITYVGFGRVDRKMVENFMGLTYETTQKIWDTFLPMYLQTENEEKIKEVNDKAAILAYARYMRHVVRRNEQDTEEGKKIVSMCQKEIENLIQNIDYLSF